MTGTPLSQVEGTPQRAAAKRDWFVEIVPADQPKPDGVEALLRLAAFETIDIRRRYNEGTLPGDNASAAVVALAKPLAASLEPLHGYPTRTGLDIAVHEAGGVDDGSGTAFEAIVLNFLLRVTRAACDQEEGGDEEAAIFAIDAAIEDTASLVLGTGTEAG